MTRQLLVVLSILAPGPAAAQERVTPASVVARIRENEARYDDLEVRYVSRRHDPQSKPNDPDGITSTNRVRSVRQKGMTRVESVWTCTHEPRVKLPYRSAFDGDVTRVWLGQEQQEYPRGERNNSDLFQPHILMFDEMMWAPLSVWLTGGLEFRYYSPWLVLYDTVDVRTRSVGRGRVRGIDCVRVVYDYFQQNFSGKPEHLETVTLWLSPAHNYLPVRMESAWAYKPYIIGTEADCTDFREVRPGVWVPYRTEVSHYDWFEGVRGKSAFQTVVVETVRTNPPYPLAFFRDVGR